LLKPYFSEDKDKIILSFFDKDAENESTVLNWTSNYVNIKNIEITIVYEDSFTLTIDPAGGEYIKKDETQSTDIIIKKNIVFSKLRYIPICTGFEEKGRDYDEGNYGWCISKPVKTGYTLNGKPIDNHTGWSIKIEGSNEEAYQENKITNYYND
jgi:hypothetical protein